MTVLSRSWKSHGFSRILKFSGIRKSNGILTRNGQGRGKVMDLLN